MSPLQALIDAGLTLRAGGARLIVTPASVLTDSLRELIRQNRAELVALLKHPNVWWRREARQLIAAKYDGETGIALGKMWQAEKGDSALEVLWARAGAGR